MFRKKTEENLLQEGDVRRMIEAIDNIASGDFNEIDATDFNNPLYADKLNSMLKAVKQVNNPVVMRLNETMEILGDNTLIKDTLNQVETQTKSIQHMENASQHLESSIENISMAMGHIRDNAHDIISVSHNVTVDMNDSIKAVNATSKQIENISQSYSILSDDCLKSGQRVFKVGRYLDKTRSDLVRGCSKITQQDWMRVFEVDHYILTWRVYNNIVGFEHLLKKQVDDPSRCKLGKWIAQLKDDNIVNSSEFKQLVKTHNDLHHYAELSWQANEDGDKEKAMRYFDDTYNTFSQFDDALSKLQKKMHQLGYNDMTAIVAFEK